MDIVTATQTIQDTSVFFSSNLTAYVIFISILFLVAFMFVCYQLLKLFKNILEKLLSEMLVDLKEIKEKVNELEKEVKRLKWHQLY